MANLLVTLIAADRPGVIERLAHCISLHQGNWLDSQMARMAGQFAGILQVQVSDEQRGNLEQALLALTREGMQVQVTACVGAELYQAERVSLSLLGNDRPGIVRDISRQLSELGVNVEHLTTGVRAAPMSGEVLFYAQAQLALPAGLPLERLQTQLEALADELMVELTPQAA